MCSTNNEEKSVVAKSVYIDKFDDIVSKYNNTYHSEFKMKPVGVNSRTYIYFHKENDKENSKFIHHARISKYKILFQFQFLQMLDQNF